MIQKLIPMTDFVLQQEQLFKEKKANDCLQSLLMFRYANVLKTPLALNMFVPADENGNPLQDPGLIPSQELNDYRKAKDKILFEGFTGDYDDEGFYVENKEHVTLFPDEFGTKIIEHLTQDNLTLTPHALKLIYG